MTMQVSDQSTLPRPLTRFIGRDDEIETILALVRRDDVRLLTLTGPGGIGKTRLSIELAHLVDQLPDWSATFVTLASATSADDALPLIAGALGLWNSQRDDAIPRLARLIQSEQVLLVIDNLEHVIDIAPELSQLLESTESLTILATSRSPLHIQGEREYAVPQLTVPETSPDARPDDLLRSEAVTLFIDRANSVGRQLRLDDETINAIAGICTQLEGLPLAIELAAARTRALPPAALLARLDDQLSLLRSEARDLPERLRTIRATIEWSYRLLAPVERDAFQRLSVFAGDFPLSAAEAVLQVDAFAALDRIESLLDQSLLMNREPFGDEPHFRMLSVVRQFGLEMLNESGSEHQVRELQSEWAASLAESSFAGQFGPDQANVFSRLDRISSALHQSLIWSIEQQQWDVAARIAGNLWQYWDLFGYLGQGRAWLRRIVEQDRDWPESLIPRLFYGFAILAGEPGDADENLSYGRRLLENEQFRDDVRIQATAYNMIGLCQDSRIALEASRESVRLWEAAGEPVWLGLAASLAGRWERELGDLDASLAYSEKARDILKSSGHIWGEATASLGIGRVRQLRGDNDRADEIYRETLTQLAKLGDRILVLRIFEFMSEIAAHRKQWEQAVTLASAAERLREVIGYELRYKAEAEAIRQFESLARNQLGDDRYDAIRESGQRLSMRDVIDLALRPRPGGNESEPVSTVSANLLTRRELDVLTGIVAGKTDQAIADELFVSYRTVTTHVTNILNKLGANSRTEAAAIAVRERLLENM